MFFHDEEEEEKKEERPGPAAPSCYGCAHFLASPVMECYHPNSIKVLWDPVRNKSYRLPSIPLCREQGGICRFYDPSPERGAEYSILKEYEKLEASKRKDKESLRTINDRTDTLIENLKKEGNLDKFMDDLNTKYIKLLGTDEEDVEEEDEG